MRTKQSQPQIIESSVPKEAISIIDKSQEEALVRKIQELEKENDSLEEDLKMTIIRQRETGASANEVLRRLESEITK